MPQTGMAFPAGFYFRKINHEIVNIYLSQNVIFG
jgi:hypothetical protein